MGIFQRDERPGTAVADDLLDENIDESRRQLRDEADVDPVVEEATARLREELRHLVARDEWGRELAWRHVARIALGPVLTRLRDQETTIRLLEATRNAPEIAPERSAEDDLLDALEVALEHAAPIEIETSAPIGEELATEATAEAVAVTETIAVTEPVAVVEQPGPVEAEATPEEIQHRWL